MSSQDTTVEKRLKLTRDEAARRIRTAPSGTKFFAHVALHADSADSDTNHYPHANRTSLTLSRAQAEKLCAGYFSDKREAEGLRVPLVIRKTEWMLVDKKRVSVNYWIG
jgi:hypothetical protein